VFSHQLWLQVVTAHKMNCTKKQKYISQADEKKQIHQNKASQE